MALVPLKQTVTVEKWSEGDNDGWDVGGFGEPIEYKVRASETIEKVTNELGEEVVASVKLTFDKFPDIGYDDRITYTNENGVTISREPLKIRPVRMINGKPTLTAVYL